jgi:hypothetical protein
MTRLPSRTVADRRTTVAMLNALATVVWPCAAETYMNYRRAPSRCLQLITRARARARARRVLGAMGTVATVRDGSGELA